MIPNESITHSLEDLQVELNSIPFILKSQIIHDETDRRYYDDYNRALIHIFTRRFLEKREFPSFVKLVQQYLPNNKVEFERISNHHYLLLIKWYIP